MRIALITDGIWPYVLGGMQKHSYYLCKYLAKNKVHVDLVHFNASNYDIGKLEFFSDEERQYIHSIIIDFPKTAKFPGHYLYQSYLHSKLVYEALKEKLDTYDLIYTKGFTGWYLIRQNKKKRLTKTRVGVKFHGYEMFQKAPDFKTKLQHVFLLRRPTKLLSKEADLVFSYGGKITGIIRSLGVEPSKIVELPSGVEKTTLVREIKPVSAKIRFLFLGRYERRKGIEELNSALRSLIAQNKFSNAEFHFIGPIPNEKRINHPSVTYHGEIRDRESLQNLTRSCDVLLCPSWSEGMPNVILEAMAGGLAVMATDVGATNVLVNDKTGWLLPNSNSNEIQKAIENALRMPASEIDSKKQNALLHLGSNFTWEKLIVKFENLVLKN